MQKMCVLAALVLGGSAYPQAPVGLDQFLGVIQPREIGPTMMGGRIADIAVYEKDPRIFYVATASGGLWKTTNAGLTFAPVFFKEATVSLGTVTVSQSDPNVVWVGTGEKDSRNSTSWGDGVYKSTDGGKTWTNMGLKDSMHIARIILNPTKPETVFVAALGHLWGENDERGIYKSEDGGTTWTRVLSEGPRSGFISLEMDPKNPNNMLAASWERMRYSYKWAGGGPATHLYRTTDGGKTWKVAMKGIPESDTGRIGISYYRQDPKIVVACVEKAPAAQGATAKSDGGIYRSTDGGESWAKVNDLDPRPFYFSQIRQDPVNANRIYLVAVQSYVSDDAGKTFKTLRESVHVDHHALWIDPSDNNHLIHGSDGGVAETRDGGDTWEHMNYLRIGQFYAVTVDMRKPYWVYGGLQDNGSWAGPTQSARGGVTMHDWYNIGGGDGFHTQNDPEDWHILYSESQGGAIGRIDQVTGDRASIRPRTGPEGTRLRFNWSTPFIISPHNHQTLYIGSQFLHKSVDRGDHWEVVSPDLSTNDTTRQDARAGVTPEDTGAERNTCIITISESPMKQGLVWVGTDDGKVQMTRDDGKTWTDLTGKFEGVPEKTWVSRVTASAFVEGRAYVTFDGHRDNNFKPFVFATEDYGATWTNITANLPDGGPVYVIAEGLHNPDLLMVGTEFGLYFSNTKGIVWQKYTTGDWPTVRVDDVTVHPREDDLVIATHGRSIWTLPLWPLEQLTSAALDKDVFVCRPQNVYTLGYVSGGESNGDGVWSAANTQPSASIFYYLKAATTEAVKVSIQRPDGTEVTSLTGTGNAGLNVVRWSPNRRQGADAGDFAIVVKIGEKEYRSSLTVEDLSRSKDPNVYIPHGP